MRWWEWKAAKKCRCGHPMYEYEVKAVTVYICPRCDRLVCPCGWADMSGKRIACPKCGVVYGSPAP